jgi:ubiquinone/menaquinone biosynthesis C-methylase UbiE
MKSEFIKNYYNESIREHYKDSYEYERWHKSPVLEMGYQMTKDCVEAVSKVSNFKNYLELGPGPGTWTRIFIDLHPGATFTLVDISSEMLNLARKNLVHDDLNLIESDFGSFNSPNTFDFFFSSRAIEYLPDHVFFLKKIYNLMSSGSQGYIITKTPHYWRQRMFRRSVPVFHQGQIEPKRLASLLLDQGFKIISIVPVVTVIPLSHSARLSQAIHRLFKRVPFTFITGFFSESYAVHFKKI